MPKYEFGILNAYILRVPRVNFQFFNFRNTEELREIQVEGGLPYALQVLSDEGWRIVYVVQQMPQADNDWTQQVWFQREVRDENL